MAGTLAAGGGSGPHVAGFLLGRRPRPRRPRCRRHMGRAESGPSATWYLPTNNAHVSVLSRQNKTRGEECFLSKQLLNETLSLQKMGPAPLEMHKAQPRPQGPGVWQGASGQPDRRTQRALCRRGRRGRGRARGVSGGRSRVLVAVGCLHSSCGALKAAGPQASTPELALWCNVKHRFESEGGCAGWRAAGGPRQLAVVTERARDLGGSLGREDVGAFSSPSTQTVCKRMRLADTGMEGRADNEVGPSPGTQKSLVGGAGGRGPWAWSPSGWPRAALPACRGVGPPEQTAIHLPVTRVPIGPPPRVMGGRLDVGSAPSSLRVRVCPQPKWTPRSTRSGGSCW